MARPFQLHKDTIRPRLLGRHLGSIIVLDRRLSFEIRAGGRRKAEPTRNAYVLRTCNGASQCQRIAVIFWDSLPWVRLR